MLSMRFHDLHLPAFGKNWKWFLLWGIGLIILGLLSISESAFATLISVVIFGYLIFFSGAIVLIDTITFWRGRWRGFLLHLVVALLYLTIGFILIMNPVEGSVSLTLLLGLFYLVIGVFRIGMSTSARLPNWGWSLFNGIVTVILGMLILSSWPASSLFIIGLFIGIDLVFLGVSYIMYALAAQKIAKI